MNLELICGALWNALVSTADKLPNLIPALIAILGLGWQLKRNSEEQLKNRLHQMRKDVLLAVAADAVAAARYLANIGNLNATDEANQEIIKGLGQAGAKLHLVGSVAMIENLLKAEGYLGIETMKLTVKRIGLKQRQTNAVKLMDVAFIKESLNFQLEAMDVSQKYVAIHIGGIGEARKACDCEFTAKELSGYFDIVQKHATTMASKIREMANELLKT